MDEYSLPLVSVLVPVYNKGEVLLETIESILNQNYRSLEILICDDSSTDDSYLRIVSFSDPRIKIFRNEENLGISKTMNFLIREAKGEFIVRVDADDVNLPTRINTQVEYMLNHPYIDIASGWMEKIGDEEGIIKLDVNHHTLFNKILFQTPIFQPASIMRRNIFDRFGIFYREDIGNVGEDWVFWAEIGQHVRFGNIPEVLIQYRINHGNVTGSGNFIESRINSFTQLFSQFGLPINQVKTHLLALNPIHIQDYNEFCKVLEWMDYLKDWNQVNNRFDKSLFENGITAVKTKVIYLLIDKIPWRFFRLVRHSSTKVAHFRYFLRRLF